MSDTPKLSAEYLASDAFVVASLRQCVDALEKDMVTQKHGFDLATEALTDKLGNLSWEVEQLEAQLAAANARLAAIRSTCNGHDCTCRKEAGWTSLCARCAVLELVGIPPEQPSSNACQLEPKPGDVGCVLDPQPGPCATCAHANGDYCGNKKNTFLFGADITMSNCGCQMWQEQASHPPTIPAPPPEPAEGDEPAIGEETECPGHGHGVDRVHCSGPCIGGDSECVEQTCGGCRHWRDERQGICGNSDSRFYFGYGRFASASACELFAERTAEVKLAEASCHCHCADCCEAEKCMRGHCGRSLCGKERGAT